MASRFLPWHSIHVRITLTTLILFLVCLWSLSYYANLMLRKDLQSVLSEQQLSTAKLVAADLNDDLEIRLNGLKKIAHLSTQAMLKGQAAMQAVINNLPVLQDLFNGGIFACYLNGNTIARSNLSVELSSGQPCMDYLNLDATIAAFKQGPSMTGQPRMAKNHADAFFEIAVPIRDTQGELIGVLAGLTNLNKPSFFDHITRNHYGLTGGFLIIAPQSRLIIAATDKNLAMEVLPAPGINTDIDRFIAGDEGSKIIFNTRGVEILVSDIRIPAASWILAVVLPTKEAFAPIERIQQHMLIRTILMTLLAGIVSWWILRRQLAPLLTTVKTLDDITSGKQARQTLPITRQDEIGQLIDAFNHLLQTLEQQEAALKNSEILGRSILDSVPAEIAVLNSDGIIMMVNQPWREFALKNSIDLGKPAPKTEIGTNYLAICKASIGIGANDALNVYEGIRAVLDGRLSTFMMEYSCDSPDQAQWFSLVVTPLGHDGQGVVVSHTNISERKKIEESLQLTRLGVTAASEALFWITHDARIIDVNAAASRLLGYTREELLQIRIPEINPSSNITAEQWQRDFALLKQGGSMKFESECRAKDGRMIPVEVAANHVHFDNKEFYCAFVRDLTDRKHFETALMSAKAVAEKANNAKSRFLAAASHDLRQPLSALSLYVDMLKQRVSTESKNIIDNIEQCVASLSELLTDLLDISKLDAGVVAPKLSNFAIDDLLTKLVSVYAAESTMKGLRLHLRQSGVMVRSDHRLLHRIIGNLISNAIRYTKKGGVLVACRRHEGKHWVEVWDTGVGIPDDKIDIIFEEFMQLGDDARNRGSGLGLSIVSKMAGVLGLQIRMRSRLGYGSMFAIELPVIQTIKAEPIAPVQHATKFLRIGVIEDNTQVLQALVLTLETAGHEVIAATTANQLLEFLGDRTPDLIISDYRLAEGVNSFDVIRITRGAFGQTLPAIIITGDTDPTLIRSMRDRDITILYKPLQLDTLQIIINQVTKQGTT